MRKKIPGEGQAEGWQPPTLPSGRRIGALEYLFSPGLAGAVDEANKLAEDFARTQREKPRAEARVLAAWFENPGATDTEIARLADVNRTSLYRMEKFRRARAEQKKERARFPRRSAAG
jgi:hypothetical protein